MHGNIAVFIPHLGCPHACSFCDQRSISGAERPVTPEEVSALLREAFARIYLTQDQLETLLNTDGNAGTDYIQKLQACTEQLTKATTLLQ